MKKIVCEVCGSNELKKQGDEFVCQHCGTKYSTEDAQKLFVEIDSSEQINNFLTLARREKSATNYGDAYTHYSKAQELNPGNWEPAFYTTYCKAMNSTIAELMSVTKTMQKHMQTIADVLLDEKDIQVRQNAIKLIITDMKIMCEFFIVVSKGEYEKNPSKSSFNVKNQYVSEMKEIALLYAASGLYLAAVDDNCGNQNTDLIIDLYKRAIDTLAIVSPLTTDGFQQTVMMIGGYIKKYDPSYQVPVLQKMSTSGGCYVATCVYGSYDCPEVWVLRRYRDNTLMNSWKGRAFVKLYYCVSPRIVKLLGKTTWFNKIWKPVLNRIVDNLKDRGYCDLPYIDK